MEKRVDRICSFLMACLLLIHISCTENSRVEDLRKELPENIQSSLQELYPDEIPQSTEQIIDPSTEEVCYYVSFSDGTYFVFNAAAEWTSIHFNSKELPSSIQTTYEDAIRQIEAETTSPIQALDKTLYGIAFELEDQRWRAYSTEDKKLLGKEMEHNTGLQPNQYLPDQVYVFASFSFDAEIEHVIVPLDESQSDFRYSLWLSNHIVVDFDQNNDWLEVRHAEKAYLPDSFYASLPGDVVEQLAEACPEKNIYLVRQMKSEQTIQYDFETDDQQIWGFSIPNPDYTSPTILPDKEVRAFINRYFGGFLSNSMVLPLDSKDRVVVSLSNGFDFTVNMQGEWMNIDNHNFGWSALKEELISSEILKAVEEKYQTTITSISRPLDQPQVQYILADEGDQVYYVYSATEFVAQDSPRTPYEKAYRYIRYHYPTEISFWLSYEQGKYRALLDDGTSLLFDEKGELIK